MRARTVVLTTVLQFSPVLIAPDVSARLSVCHFAVSASSFLLLIFLEVVEKIPVFLLSSSLGSYVILSVINGKTNDVFEVCPF